ncbi:MAG: hypothetical protein HON51_05605 [Gammaproteobacteria bacterium]|jgi:hypothetical protein|nr:hypothetical protein [Gammaproteobacteria bacterium]MBT5827208.1 hypothetical protein [Gammaproteobacteria bacterium]MBT6419921.1 hypothetical protein [Gammaproteobacteria bacterium]MBT6575697.1 hypothetical protein [Gammaproteobacteria bacterium]
MQASIHTPWGISQNIETISRGIQFVDTTGHGGVKVSDELNKKIPNWVREGTFGKLGLDGWYEEDCDWCIPVIVFSKVFYAWANNKGQDGEAYIAEAQRIFRVNNLSDPKKACSGNIEKFLNDPGNAVYE